MLKEERFAKIIEYLKINNTAKLNELAEVTGVSVDTVRRDLETLEQYGVLNRVRGGAVWRRESLEQHVYEMRTTVHSEEKKKIASLIENVLEDGKTVVMGSSSTTVEIARHIAHNYKRLMVITNDNDIAKILSENDKIKIVHLGGVLDPEENATYGKLCEEELLQYNADVCILSVNGISIEKGLSDFRLNQIDTFRRMMEISEKTVVAVDSSKFKKSSSMIVCDIDSVDCIISDSGLDEATIDKLRQKNIDVITGREESEA